MIPIAIRQSDSLYSGIQENLFLNQCGRRRMRITPEADAPSEHFGIENKKTLINLHWKILVIEIMMQAT
ncbi:MAG TPA: hypothetical protein VGD14_02535 [bacterium]